MTLPTNLTLEHLTLSDASQILEEAINLKLIPVDGQGKHLTIVEGRVCLKTESELILRLQKYSGGHMFLWVGDEAKFTSIKCDSSIPSNLTLAIGSNTTAILSDYEANCHLSSTSLASKLSIKFNEGKPFYLSLNAPKVAPYLVDRMSMGLMQAIKQFMSQAVEAFASHA